MNWLQNLWHHYAQTIFGMAEFFAGLAEFIDANTINIVGSFFGPKWGPIVSKSIQCGCGLVVAVRASQARREQRDKCG